MSKPRLMVTKNIILQCSTLSLVRPRRTRYRQHLGGSRKNLRGCQCGNSLIPALLPLALQEPGES